MGLKYINDYAILCFPIYFMINNNTMKNNSLTVHGFISIYRAVESNVVALKASKVAFFLWDLKIKSIKQFKTKLVLER